MNVTLRSAALCAMLAIPAVTLAQQPPSPATGRWSLGVGAALIDSPNAGEGTRVRPFPLISYDGDRVFLRGLSGGVHLYQSGYFTVDAIASVRLYGFDIDDLGAAELLANGIDATQLSDRDDGLDAGFRVGFGSTWGSIALEAVHDISDTSDGYEISLDYSYRWLFDQTAITAIVGVSRMSSELTRYYFGTLDEEVARGVLAYSPGSADVPRAGLTLTHSFGSSQWQLLGSLEYRFFPDELTNSPLLERDSDGTGRLVLGLSKRF